MSTIASQLQSLKSGKHSDAKTAYVDLLLVSGSDELDAAELKHIVDTCSEMGISIDQFDIDRKMAGGLAATQDKIDTEKLHRKRCAATSKKISNLAGVLPRQVSYWLNLPYLPVDRTAQKKKKEKVRQLYSELVMNQSLLAQAEAARESLKRQKERNWWIEPYLRLESEQP